MNKTTLLSQGIKFEQYWGDDVRAHHMNTRSVYRFIKNSNVFITHTAPLNYSTDTFEDQFRVQVTKLDGDRSSITSTIATFSDFNSAYYVALTQLSTNN